MATDPKYKGNLALALGGVSDVLSNAVQNHHTTAEQARDLAAAGAYALESIEKLMIICSLSNPGYERQDFSTGEQELLEQAKHQVRLLAALGAI